MKKIILTENQMKIVLNSIINETDGDVTNSIIQNITDKFNEFKNNFSKQIESANRIVDMDNLINVMQKYALVKVPKIADNDIDPEAYLNEYYNFMLDIFKKEANNLGWAKKKLIKAILGEKEKAMPTMDSWKFKDLIWSILYLGGLPEGIKDNWTNTYNANISKNKLNFYQNVRNILINSIYS